MLLLLMTMTMIMIIMMMMMQYHVFVRSLRFVLPTWPAQWCEVYPTRVTLATM